MDKNSNVIEVNVKELLRVLLRRVWIIILVAVLAGAGAGYYTENYMQPYYTSSSKLYILNKQMGEHTTMSDLQIGTTLMQDFIILIKSRPVMDQVISEVNLDMSHHQLASMVSLHTPTATRILEISVTHSDPDMAKLLVDTVSEVASESMVSIMGIDKVNVVEEGNYPSYPSGPNTNRNIRLGVLAGMLLSGLIITIIFLLNDTIKTSDDIEKYLDLTALGVIPVESTVKRKMEKQRGKQKQKGKNAA